MQGVHPNKQNMVFFGAPGIAGRPSLHAIVSRLVLPALKLKQPPMQMIATLSQLPPAGPHVKSYLEGQLQYALLAAQFVCCRFMTGIMGK